MIEYKCRIEMIRYTKEENYRMSSFLLNNPVSLLQAGHIPPQSMSLSSWFLIPSMQVGQTLLHGPPQSIPFSPWFWIPSMQVGPWVM